MEQLTRQDVETVKRINTEAIREYPERVSIQLLWCRECRGYHVILANPDESQIQGEYIGFSYTHQTVDDALLNVADYISL